MHPLCPVSALCTYVHRSGQWRKSEQLLVCFGSDRKSDAVSKQCISTGIVEGFVQGGFLAGCVCGCRVVYASHGHFVMTAWIFIPPQARVSCTDPRVWVFLNRPYPRYDGVGIPVPILLNATSKFPLKRNVGVTHVTLFPEKGTRRCIALSYRGWPVNCVFASDNRGWRRGSQVPYIYHATRLIATSPDHGRPTSRGIILHKLQIPVTCERFP